MNEKGVRTRISTSAMSPGGIRMAERNKGVGMLMDSAKLEKLGEEIAELTTKVPEAGATLPNSPVADY